MNTKVNTISISAPAEPPEIPAGFSVMRYEGGNRECKVLSVAIQKWLEEGYIRTQLRIYAESEETKDGGTFIISSDWNDLYEEWEPWINAWTDDAANIEEMQAEIKA